MAASRVVLERMTEKPKEPAAVGNVTELLQRLVRAYGSNAVAEMLGVNKAMISHWTRKVNPKPISPTMAGRIIDVHDVINRALQVFQPQIAADWLAGSEPLLDGARPIDVLKKSWGHSRHPGAEGSRSGRVCMIFYRVFPFDRNAAEDQPGGALFVPRSNGVWRIDDPDLYDVFYVSSHAEGAIAEAFGQFSVWRPETFINAAGLRSTLTTHANW